MSMRVCLGLILMAAVPVWAQVESEPQAEASPDQTQMIMPPIVSGQNYPMAVGADVDSNYMYMAMVTSTGYIDNLYPGGTGGALAETTTIIQPSITIDQSEGRQHRTFSYMPGFTFYQPSSQLNEIDQNVNGNFQYRITPHVTAAVGDSFQRSSTAYNTASIGAVSPAPSPAATGVIPPFALMLINSATGRVGWQFGRNSMLGGSGQDMILHYPKSTQVTGLVDSDSRGASVFMAHRLSGTQYFGVTYQYYYILEYPPVIGSALTETDTVYPFYTIILGKQFSATISGGPQYEKTTVPGQPVSSSVGPSVTGSLGWQGLHSSFSVGYQDQITAGGGLVGAYHAQMGSVSGRWQFSRNWTASLAGGYSSYRNAGSVSGFATPGGHTLDGTVTVDRVLSDHLHLEGEYDRLHESYSQILAIASAPDSDRVMVSLRWQLRRPLGQ